jgi:hypothetical protein
MDEEGENQSINQSDYPLSMWIKVEGVLLIGKRTIIQLFIG